MKIYTFLFFLVLASSTQTSSWLASVSDDKCHRQRSVMFPSALVGILRQNEDNLEELVESLITSNDEDGSGDLSFEEFEGAFEVLVGNAQGLRKDRL